MKIRTLIVDDEVLARRRILSLLKSDPSFEVAAECADGQSAIRAIAEHKPGLVFLDVQMPEVDGFGVLEAVSPVDMPAIIFVTAFDQYALKAFDTQAIDYLLKPFKQERFMAALARAKSRIQAGRVQLDPEALVALFRAVDRDRARLVVRAEGKVVFLRTAEVEWVEADANYVRVHTRQRTYNVREKISVFERSLPEHKFVRIHRSVIVNLDAVAEIQNCGNAEHVVILRSGKELPLGRTYRERLDSVIGSPQ
jgi:two-component system, LytTR family, response regulator